MKPSVVLGENELGEVGKFYFDSVFSSGAHMSDKLLSYIRKNGLTRKVDICRVSGRQSREGLYR